jgi:hypothetical protein
VNHAESARATDFFNSLLGQAGRRDALTGPGRAVAVQAEDQLVFFPDLDR